MMSATVGQLVRRLLRPRYAATGVVVALVVVLLANWGGGTGNGPTPSALRLPRVTATPRLAPTAPLPPPVPSPLPSPTASPVSTALPVPRVGLQVGHWHIAALPDSLARLRDQTGTAAAGRTELQLNLDVARRTAALLEAAGVQVDLLPATVPDGYRADAFVAIHADGNFARAVRGYKVAPPWRAGVAWGDAALTAQIQAAYSTATGLPRDPEVTDNMRGYYAINGWMGAESRISAGTPSAVIETGFMTSAADRAVLFAHPERVAAGVAGGILAFLQGRASGTAEQQRAETVAALAPTGCSAVVLLDDVPIRAAPNPSAAVIAWVNRGDILPYLDSTNRPRGPFTNTAGRRLAAQTGYYRIGRPGGGPPAYINSATVIVQLPQP
jgi:hypothetical protein